MEERPEHEAEWREVLLGRHPEFRLGRKLFKHLPSQPRCKLCAAPFGGAGGPLMRLIGKAPWPKNPKYCGSCFKQLTAMLEHLDTTEREALVRFHARGESVREIATSLGLPEGTVKSHLHRARQKLARFKTGEEQS